MIISASYKTDIPAFYGSWFMNRLRAGYCLMTQPYNGKTLRISLQPQDVDGFVFWTKNISPFLKHLPEIPGPFVIQYTINGYPRQLEYAVVDPKKSIQHMHRIADQFGPEVCVWRYDTILLTSLTDLDFHRKNFRSLAERLAGATNEVVISFAHFYRKTQTNLRRAASSEGFDWHDPSSQIKRNLCKELFNLALEHGMKLTVCAQPEYQSGDAGTARCIDATRLSAIAGRPIAAKTSGNRPACLCNQCRDIGEYDTCPHGCVYCYAVRNHTAAVARHQQHDPHGEYLFAPVICNRSAGNV
ncbi:MAG TPA: DUF1848 domain-containing protein [Tepidisphaeraceae bacterium]|nr:DUF1848 domain-containing protein [Tepidisphaeraceae bacterium]